MTWSLVTTEYFAAGDSLRVDLMTSSFLVDGIVSACRRLCCWSLPPCRLDDEHFSVDACMQFTKDFKCVELM